MRVRVPQEQPEDIHAGLPDEEVGEERRHDTAVFCRRQPSRHHRPRPVVGAGGQRDRDGQEADGLEADQRDGG